MSNTVKNHIQELIDRETLGLNTKNPDLFLDTIHPDMVWPWPTYDLTTTTRFDGALC